MSVSWREAEPPRVRPEDIRLEILYEDEDLLAVNKPAGLVVHPAAGHAAHTLVNALLHHCAGGLSGIGGVARPGLVHRLDKDTSGLPGRGQKRRRPPPFVRAIRRAPGGKNLRGDHLRPMARCGR